MAVVESDFHCRVDVSLSTRSNMIGRDIPALLAGFGTNCIKEGDGS